MSRALRSHVDDDGHCWCASDELRAAELDAAYPDRRRNLGGLFGAPTCVHAAGHGEPCHHGTNRPGEPCHYCGGPTDPTAVDRPGCPTCWTDLTTMAVADVKALFAAHDSELSLNPVTGKDG